MSSASSTPLFEAYPKASTLPYVSLASLPTPVQAMPELGRELGISQLYCKRDDMSGQAYGGNKVRKLEFLLGEAKALGQEHVMTIGAIGSNHVLATCIYARQLGMSVAAQHYPQPVTDHVRDNLLALSTTKPELKLLGHPVQLPFTMFKAHLKSWMAQRPPTYYVPAGGSSALGSMGYVNAAFELKRQIQEGLMPEPDVIFVTAGTCGTVSGLALGLAMAGLKTHICAVRVVDRVVCNKANIKRLIHQGRALLEQHGVTKLPEVPGSQVSLVQGYFGEAYGVATAQGLHAQQLVEQREGLHLDPTYTSKTFAALIGERHRLSLKDKVVLFWQTLSSVDLSERIAQAQPERDLPPEYMDFLQLK